MPQQRRLSGSGLLLEQFPQLEEILENEQGEHDQLLSACVAPKVDGLPRFRLAI